MGSFTKAADVRRSFIEFFEGKGHTHVPSSPTVPHDDPTLMFANAGMNQFKPAFLGNVPAGHPLAGLKRATNTQKCIRAGGKHNDLEDVGRDTYHHTFFEMLGNWSFGDYFKAEAVDWAWELLTQVWGLDPDRLYATYFGGDEKLGLGPDTEARDLWLAHLPAERVIASGVKDNFWEMGDTGPCGPCSEIHYDRIGGRNAARRVNADGEDVIEIWNLVFIQYDRQADGSLKPLPDKHIDTGMGLERIASILRGVESNYDTDLFTPIFAAIEQLTGARGYRGKYGAEDPDGVDTAYRVIADHVRTLTFALTDGAVPGNEGRGYVLRRILRRAVRFGRQRLGAKTGFFSRLVPVVVEHMGEAFPELTRDPKRVIDLIHEEETSFGRTLDRGIRLFEEAAASAGPAGRISGEDAFKLYDTYGFPLDLTVLMAEERGQEVDIAGFEAEMAAQKERSRAGAKTGGEGGLVLDAEAIAKLRALHVRETDDSPKFSGKEVRATVRAIFNGSNFDESIDADRGSLRPFGVVFDRTNFYAEMGGQVADTGLVMLPGGGEFRVEDVRNFGGYILHIGRLKKGTVRVNEDATLMLDGPRRRAIASNHTATHLLNLALRRVLGEGADQKGSLVAEDRLRFDFSRSGAVDAERLGEAERIVRGLIEEDLPVHAEVVPLDEARKINGLRAVFGETYPDPVRVVSIGPAVGDLLADPGLDAWREYSVEFCGGTHLARTGEAGAFALVQEEAVAKGIRRVVAVTGPAAVAAHAAADEMERRIEAAADLKGDALKAEYRDISAQIDELTMPAARKAALRGMLGGLAEAIKQAEKAEAGERAAEAARHASVLATSAEAAQEPYFVSTIEVGSDRAALQSAIKTIAGRVPRKAVMLLSPDESAGKVAVMAVVPKEHQNALKAGEWVREVTGVMGGKGGGKPDSAQGAGRDLGKVRDAVQAATRFAGGRLL
ncbi:MAG TPA: alanine--tRNA ligase [Phycisphaerales bacterium]|nr:alanine--tRNA ligase [Phycisphaerales bacterium]